jgi:sugar (pentulose or hexulose) kinase
MDTVMAKAEDVVVGVDVGSKAARAVALDPRGTLVAEASVSYDAGEDRGEGRVDPSPWRRAVEEVLGELHGSCPRSQTPAALAVGGQSPTTVSLAGDDALTYRYRAGVDGGPVAQHKAQRALLAAEHPGTAVAQLWDWILHLLGAPLVQGRWPGDVSVEGFGDRVDTGEVVGKANGSCGVAVGTPLVPGAPDAILTFWAAGLDEPGRGCDPGGRTGGLVVTSSVSPSAIGLMNMASPSKGNVMVGGPVSAHGASLDWLASVTGRSVEVLLALAAEVPAGSRGLMFLPYLDGERVPRWRRELSGELYGLRTDTTVGELARSVLEGAAYGLGHVATVLRGAGVPIEAVTCTGTPSSSRLWCGIKASILGVPVDVPAFAELSAYGAALAAGAGAKWWPRPATAGPGSWPRPAMDRVEPAAEPEYERGMRRFIALGDDAERRLDCQG